MSIEEEFFKTFGIEPKYIEGENLMEYSYGKLEYPEITDHILLELICILNKFTGYTSLLNDNCQDIKEEILKDTLFVYEQLRKSYKLDLKHQVRSLFEGVKE